MKRRPPITGKPDDNKKDCEKNFALVHSGEWCRSRFNATGTDLEERCDASSRRIAILNHHNIVGNKRAKFSSGKIHRNE